MARPTALSRAHLLVRSASRPATAAASPPASRTAGRKFLRAIPAVPMTPQRTVATLPPPLIQAPAGIIPPVPPRVHRYHILPARLGRVPAAAPAAGGAADTIEGSAADGRTWRTWT